MAKISGLVFVGIVRATQTF